MFSIQVLFLDLGWENAGTAVTPGGHTPLPTDAVWNLLGARGFKRGVSGEWFG
jgi:hypothetical protein